MNESIELIDVSVGPEMNEVRDLFMEYAASLNFSLCFQNFDVEVSRLPGEYASPLGRIILCRVNGQTAGCIAVKPLSEGICEMKRLFVRPAFRGRKLGRRLALHLIQEAKVIGYHSMRLDTIAGTMEGAIALYRSLGFEEIPPYYDNPIPNAVYLELKL
jgi:putative acetyltransferase